MEGLAGLERTDIVALPTIGRESEAPTRQIALRHDVDADLETAVACAKILRETDIPGTFFLLHTAHYYGRFLDDGGTLVFERHEGFPHFVDGLLEAGVEIGIHNDALGVILDHRGDGYAALREEIGWLRSLGATITGSAAHNSVAAYAAECFEIFVGQAAADRREVHWRDQTIPLQGIQSEDLGLYYEANHPILRQTVDMAAIQAMVGPGDLLRTRPWQERYFIRHPVFRRGYDCDVWLLAEDAWLLAHKGRVHYPLTLQALLSALAALPDGTRSVVSIHPIYVSKRDAPLSKNRPVARFFKKLKEWTREIRPNRKTNAPQTPIRVLSIAAMSYSGTTWQNLLLGSHPDVLTIGPPERLWSLRKEKFATACMVHGADCTFWPAFGNSWNGRENLFVALNRFCGKSAFIFDGASAEFAKKQMRDPRLTVLQGRYIRDGRAISASYARKMKDNGIDYQTSILPTGWLYHSFQATPDLAQLEAEGTFVVHYEKVVSDPTTFLRQAGEFLGIDYSDEMYRFWEWDHHITFGNQGPISMVQLHQDHEIDDFESRQFYVEQLATLKSDPAASFRDERWRRQLTREDLFWFDQLMGEKNALLGYDRDLFTPEEIGDFAKDGLARTEFAAALPADVRERLAAIVA